MFESALLPLDVDALHLAELGVEHGFGVRGLAEPPGLLRPKQVHGAAVATARACARGVEADAVTSSAPGTPIGVITADCVPLLVASQDGRRVAAVHAGWRGLAAGVIEAAVDAMRHGAHGGASSPRLRAVVGPHIGPCCYEVDAPVLSALGRRDPDALRAATSSLRAGHAQLDLGGLARTALERAGVPQRAIGTVMDPCTRCDALRFHSYRRDGPRAGRLVHFIAARRDTP